MLLEQESPRIVSESRKISSEKLTPLNFCQTSIPSFFRGFFTLNLSHSKSIKFLLNHTSNNFGKHHKK